jgi:thiol-disulfide isomerase/thioredoxin
LQGSWVNRFDSIVHSQRTEDLEDYIALDFSARSVNVVINPADTGAVIEPFDVVIEIDDRPLSLKEAGADIVFNERGESLIMVTEPRLYAPLELPASTRASLKMRSNSEPTTIEAELELGNIVLVDFWTYTCINCLRTMPHLKAWYEKYADHGLTILGVHTPEFEFEKDTDNVLEAVDRIGVRWPVAQDNNKRTWRRFGNHYWPAKYLFSPEHEIVYTHIGEGDYAETELAIREQLVAAGHDISDVPFEPLPADTRL